MKKLVLLLIIVLMQPAYSQWEACSNGISEQAVMTLTAHNNILYAGTCSGGVFISTDFGQTWEQKNFGIDYFNGILNFAFDSDSVYVGTQGGLYLSSNGCESWEKISSRFYDKNLLIYGLHVSGQNIYTSAGLMRFFISRDKGITWTTNKAMSRIDDFLEYESYLFAASNVGVYRSDDSGKSWKKYYDGVVYSDRVDNLYLFKNAIFGGSEQGRIYKTINYGENWETIYENQNSHEIADIFVNDDFIFAGLFTNTYNDTVEFPVTGGVIISTNNGISWVDVNKGFGDNPIGISSFVVLGEYIYAGTIQKKFSEGASCNGSGKGVFRAKLSDFGLSDVGEDRQASEEVSIFPNPAADILNINLSNFTGIEPIEIYNLLGNKVLEQVPQSSNVSVSIESLPAGAYMLRCGTRSKMFLKE